VNKPVVGKALDLGGGWTLTLVRNDEPHDLYRLSDESGWYSLIQVDSSLPLLLYQLNLMRLVEIEMEKGLVIMAANAMFGGSDVRPEPDGTG
jgi:hypothetical protein